MAVIRQLDNADAPSGVPVAQVRLSTEDLTQRFGIEWEVGVDDLDDLKSAVIRVGADGPPIGLVAYDQDPDRSVLLIMDAGSSSAEALDRVLDALQVQPRDLLGRVSEGDAASGGSPVEELASLRTQVAEQARELEALRETVQALLRVRELEAQGFPLASPSAFVGSGPRTQLDEVEDAVGTGLDWREALAA